MGRPRSIPSHLRQIWICLSITFCISNAAWAAPSAPAGSAAKGGPTPAAAAEPPLTIDFKETDIRDVLRVLAAQRGVSITYDESVRGNVTIRLTKELRSFLRASLAYPALMLLASIGAITVLITFVIPGIASLFSQWGGTLPLPTRIVLAIGRAAGRWWPAGLVLGALIGLGVRAWSRSPGGRLSIDRLRLRLPFWGRMTRLIAAVRLGGTLATMLRGGVPIIQALLTARGAAGNQVIAAAIDEAVASLRRGGSLSGPWPPVSPREPLRS